MQKRDKNTKKKQEQSHAKEDANVKIGEKESLRGESKLLKAPS